MNNKEIEEAINNVYNFLDKIDLKPYIKEYKGKNIKSMMDRLEELYMYIDKYSISLFDSVTIDEFIIYLEDRYNVNIETSTEIVYKIK